MRAVPGAGKGALARAIWAAGVESARSPLTRYLARCGAWPAPDGLGRWWPSLPGAVRWASRTDLARADWALLAGFPDDAAGAALFAYGPAPAGDWTARAVAVKALTDEGRLPASGPWSAVRGDTWAAACRMDGNMDGREIALVTGEVDALAVAFAARYSLLGLGDVAEVRAVGAGGFVPERAADTGDRPVVLLPDPGAVEQAQADAARLRAHGRTARVRDDAGDPAGALTGLVLRRGWRALMGLSDG